MPLTPVAVLPIALAADSWNLTHLPFRAARSISLLPSVNTASRSSSSSLMFILLPVILYFISIRHYIAILVEDSFPIDLRHLVSLVPAELFPDDGSEHGDCKHGYDHQ